MTWTAKSIAELKRRWNAGQTSGMIATAMHVSRNAVIGKLGRLDLLGMPRAERQRRMSSSRTPEWLANMTAGVRRHYAQKRQMEAAE